MSIQFWSKNFRPAPFRTQNHHYSNYIITDHHRRVSEFVNLIPDNAIVAAHAHLQSQLINKRGTVYINEHSKNPRYLADYVLFDKTNNNINPNSPVFMREQDWDIFENNEVIWELIKSADGYYLYNRKNRI